MVLITTPLILCLVQSALKAFESRCNAEETAIDFMAMPPPTMFYRASYTFLKCRVIDGNSGLKDLLFSFG